MFWEPLPKQLQCNHNSKYINIRYSHPCVHRYASSCLGAVVTHHNSQGSLYATGEMNVFQGPHWTP